MVGGGSVVSQNLHFPGSLAVSVQVRRRGGGVGRLEGGAGGVGRGAGGGGTARSHLEGLLGNLLRWTPFASPLVFFLASWICGSPT